MTRSIVILGVFVADTTYRATRLPQKGETLIGTGFALGPGGKGSNQAVAAARAGATVHFISRLGRDAFAEMALATWAEAGVTPAVTRDETGFTGAACIFVEEATGENAIIICPGVAEMISAADLEGQGDLIADAGVFMTQLEQPLAAAQRGLELARAGGAVTILNPAPARALPHEMLALCDYVTPNETEAAALTGLPVTSQDEAAAAARALLDRGVGAAIITLGENGVLYHDGRAATHVPAFRAGPVRETTGAGDAFNGGFAAALAQGAAPLEAVRFGCATAAISVTRAGATAAMPQLAEIEDLLARG